ncbi:sensor domain-containing diguanylate cyclase [Ancylobacter sp. A5.8]|uniref:sensor domain-containing diguanylate cyclase n=1 Tax=Ancylobacter gelatini TaxID=2919920 RepID=UPI001F4DFC29|nr:sensor domain-containing diguanylate cyclase [Ancylobacter gelatini]MCJ8144656.1 sensor domain-containing diguanylate cyclase [Ancylobacter gelatini]
MPDAIPGWFDHVRAPLVLAAGDLALVTALNAEAARLMGAGPTMPCALAELIGPEAAAAVVAMGTAGPAAQSSPPSRVLTCRVAGRDRTLDVALSRLEDGRCLLTLQDRMAEHEAADKLLAIQDDIREIMESMPVGVEIYDRDDTCLFMNHYGAALLGYGVDDVFELDDWWRLAYPDPAYRKMAIDGWAQGVRQAREEKNYIQMSEWIVTAKDGSQRLIHFRLRALMDNTVLVYWDVSDHGRLVNQLRHLADTDELTGASNRRRFLAEGEAALASARRSGTPTAVLMVDIDYFKRVNDRFGHAAGDLVLRGFVEKCRRALREQDLLARLGGEEFVALLPGTGEAEAHKVAETLRNFIAAAPMMIEGMPIPITVSIGVSVIDPNQAETAATETDADILSGLMRRADLALYAAKDGGRNRVVRDGANIPLVPAMSAK